MQNANTITLITLITCVAWFTTGTQVVEAKVATAPTGYVALGFVKYEHYTYMASGTDILEFRDEPTGRISTKPFAIKSVKLAKVRSDEFDAGVTHIAIDPTGKFLAAAYNDLNTSDYNDVYIEIFAICFDGTLRGPVSVAHSDHAGPLIFSSRAPGILYNLTAGVGDMIVYRLTSDGHLYEMPWPVVHADYLQGIDQLVFDQCGDYAYAAVIMYPNGAPIRTIKEMKVTPDGRLWPVAQRKSQDSSNGKPIEGVIAMSMDDKLIYLATTTALAQFPVRADHTLGLPLWFPTDFHDCPEYPDISEPAPVAQSPTKRSVYVKAPAANQIIAIEGGNDEALIKPRSIFLFNDGSAIEEPFLDDDVVQSAPGTQQVRNVPWIRDIRIGPDGSVYIVNKTNLFVYDYFADRDWTKSKPHILPYIASDIAFLTRRIDPPARPVWASPTRRRHKVPRL